MSVKNLYYYQSDALTDAQKRASQTSKEIMLSSTDKIGYFERVGEKAERDLSSACGETQCYYVGDDIYAFWEQD